MSTPTLTRDLAWSAAQDAANASMRAAGRSKWSQDDYRLAVETFDRLWPEERDYTEDTSTDTAPLAQLACPVPVCRTVLCFEGEEHELFAPPHVHHVDGDPTNNDRDNLEVRTGYADVDPERKGRES